MRFRRAVFAMWVALSATAMTASLTGTWTLELDPDFGGNPATLHCDVTQDGRALTIDCGEGFFSAGTVDDHAVKFIVMTGKDRLLSARFSGTLDPSESVISGTWTLEDTTGNRNGRFRADKK